MDDVKPKDMYIVFVFFTFHIVSIFFTTAWDKNLFIIKVFTYNENPISSQAKTICIKNVENFKDEMVKKRGYLEIWHTTKYF